MQDGGAEAVWDDQSPPPPQLYKKRISDFWQDSNSSSPNRMFYIIQLSQMCKLAIDGTSLPVLDTPLRNFN